MFKNFSAVGALYPPTIEEACGFRRIGSAYFNGIKYPIFCCMQIFLPLTYGNFTISCYIDNACANCNSLGLKIKWR